MITRVRLRFTLEDLYMLTLVADSHSLNEVSKIMQVRQSTLSRSMQRLERQFGCSLLSRSPKGVELTEEGRRVVGAARKTLSRFQALQVEFGETSARTTGEVRIGSVATAGVVFLPKILKRLKREQPYVYVSVWEGDLEQLVTKVAQGELDLAITDGPIQREALVSVRLWTESYVVAMHPKRRLAATGRPLSLFDLVTETFVSFPGGVSQRVVEAACEQRNLRPKFAHISNNLESIRHNVESGTGIALLPQILMPELRKWKVRTALLAPEELQRTAVLASRGKATMSRATRVVHAEIRAHSLEMREFLAAEVHKYENLFQ